MLFRSNLQARDSQYHANAIREIVQELKQELQQKYTTTSDQDSVPPVASISDENNDSSISALQSEVQSLKDYIHNMHGAYSMPLQPHLPYYLQPTPWTHPYGMQAPPMQAYCQQVSPYQVQKNSLKNTNPPKKGRIYYCHTHGACFHPGNKCRNKGPGHQDNATFAN